MKKLLLILILFLLPISFAQNFSTILSPVNQSTCPSEHVYYDLTIRNEDTKKSSYNISVSTNIEDWTNILPNQIEVEANDTKDIRIFIQPNYKIKPQNIEFSVDVISNNQKVSLKSNLNVLECRGVQFNSKPITFCEEDFHKTVIQIKNTGKVNDTFKLTSNNDWIKLKPNYISLLSNETKNISIEFSNTEKGNYNTTVSADSISSYSKTHIKIPTQIDDCYSIQSNLDKNQVNVNKSNNTVTSLHVNNTGTKKLDLNITSDTKWVTPSIDNTTLLPNESKKVFVYIAPSVEINKSSHMVTIKIESNNISLEEKIEIKLNEEKKITEPIINLGKLSDPVKDTVKFIFSPILNLFDKF